MYFDTHGHLDDRQYDGDRDTLIAELPKQGIGLFVNVGADMNSSRKAMALAQQYAFIYAAVGVHPQDTHAMTDEDLIALRDMAADPKVVAIGEIGLDYHWDDTPRDVQQHWFRKQLVLACELNLPVIIHDREAHGDCLDIVRETDYHNGVFHCYSGSAEMAAQLVQLGWHISFTGTVTFKNAVNVKAAAKCVPLERLLIETDCPYLAPTPLRGTRNTPANVRYVAQEIARLRDMDVEAVADATLQNGKRLFGIA